MNLFKKSGITVSILGLSFLFFSTTHAHNGKTAYAYPPGKTKIDGSLMANPLVMAVTTAISNASSRYTRT